MVQLNASVTFRDFVNFFPLPGDKADICNRGPVSTNPLSLSSAYPATTPQGAVRADIYAAHQAYMHGFLYFLGHDPAVPAHIRSNITSWGLCPDEFADAPTPHWPPLLYVREVTFFVEKKKKKERKKKDK